MAESWFQKHIWGSDGKDQKATPAATPAGSPPPTVMNVTAGGIPSAITTPMFASSGSGVAILDPEMIADIRKLIAIRPTPYTAMRENADAMAEALPDESSRIRAAFAMLKKSGTAPAQVLSSIDLHVRDIEEQKKNASDSASAAINRKAGGLRADAETLLEANRVGEATIQQLEQQIQQLRQQIQQRAQEASQKQAEAAQAEADIKQKTAMFNASADSVITELNTQKAQLSAMLN